MNIRPINSPEAHEAALREIESLWGAPPGTPEGDKLDVLATLVDVYESRHYPIPDADPVAILHFAIEEMGRSQQDLGRILGSRPRASEILARRRALTIEMIDAISREWRLPVEALARPYPVSPARDKVRPYRARVPGMVPGTALKIRQPSTPKVNIKGVAGNYATAAKAGKAATAKAGSSKSGKIGGTKRVTRVSRKGPTSSERA